MRYDPELDKGLPKDIEEAAIKVEQYFALRGVKEWEYGGLASRSSVNRLEMELLTKLSMISVEEQKNLDEIAYIMEGHGK